MAFGVKELLLGSSYQLQKSAILVALADSPPPSTVTTLKKETSSAPITPTRVRHSELEGKKEEPLVEETDWRHVNPEFQKRIGAIENDIELQIKVNFALDNWIGTRITNSANTLDLFLSILGREFGGSDNFDDVIAKKLKQNCKPSFKSHPHLKILVSEITFHRMRNSNKYFLKFSINTSNDHTKAFNLSSLKSVSHKIFYEQLETDVLNVDILFAKHITGRVLIPIREIQPNQEPVRWNIQDVNQGQDMGYLVLNLNLVNADKPSVKACFNRQIHEILFDNLDVELFGNLAVDKANYQNFDYFLQIVENVVDESSNIFLLGGSKLVENRSKICHNGVAVFPKNGVAFSKIRSVTEDEITIKLYRVDNRAPNTVRNSDESLEHPEPDTSLEQIDSDDSEEFFLGDLISKPRTLSPAEGAKACEIVNRKLDMGYFEKTIAISDIPWSEGLTISQGEFSWTLNIVGGKPVDEEKLPQPIFTEKNLADIMLLAYHKTLIQVGSLEDITSWNGNLSRTLRMVLNCITPCGRTADWKKAHANAIFILHKELYLNLNASVLKKHLENLQDTMLLEFFHGFCINAIANFDARKECRILQMADIVDSLSKFSMDDVQSRLEETMSNYVERVLVTGADSKVVWALKFPAEQLKHLSSRLESFCIATLKIIRENFGNFGLNMWCPLLAKLCFQVGLKKFDVIRCAHQSEHYGKENIPVDFYENAFLVFIQLREIGQYAKLVDDVYNFFEFCLPHWADCAAAKAEAQVAKVLAMEMEKQNQNEPSSADKKEYLSPGKSLGDSKENLKTKISRPGSTQSSDVITSTGNKDSWFLTDEDLKAWNENAVNVNGIFRSCEVSWHKLQWIDPIKSITKFGSPLFQKLNLVFKMYLDGMRQIVMLDNEFDKHELVLILNNCFHSMKFLDDFSYTLGCEVQRVANQMTVDSEEIKESIRAVQEQFAEAKFEADKQADEIVTAFCEGQRKHFQHLISLRKTNQGSESKAQDNEAIFDFQTKNLLLDYLDKMFFFFNVNLITGLKNEILAKKCNDKLKIRLFQISDEEIVKFYESANSISEKSEALADLDATISESLEFREDVGLTNSGTLDKIKKKLAMQVATPIELMSNYLLEIFQLKQEHAKEPKETFGKVTFRAGINGAIGPSWLKLFVHLKGVSDLLLLQTKDEGSFRLIVSILPFQIDDKSYKVSQKSLIYPANINHMFEIPSENNVDSSKHNFVFQLFKLFDSQNDKTKFLDVSLFSVSIKKTYMRFRGNALFKLSQIPIVNDEKELSQNAKCNIQGVFTQIPTLTDDKNSFLGKISFDEMSKRKDDISKSFCESQEKFQKEKQIPVVLQKSEWVNQQRSRKESCYHKITLSGH